VSQDSQSNAKDLQPIAVYEVSHALTCRELGCGKVVKISVVPSEHALGYCEYNRDEQPAAPTAQDVEHAITVALAGTASCRVIYDRADSSGTSNLARVYDLAERWLLLTGKDPHEASELIQRGYERAKELVAKHKDSIVAIAQVLAQKGTLDGDEFEALCSQHGA
jgi:ATP-dependent Zn protease